MTMLEAGERKSRRNLALLQRLWPLIAPQRALATAWLIFLLLSSATSMLLPVAVRFIIDKGFGTASATTINHVFLGLFVVAMVMALGMAARYFCITLLSERVVAALRMSLYDHLIRLDVAFYERRRVGELLSRLGSDTEVLQTLLGSRISVALGSLVTGAASLTMMVWTSPKLAVLAAVLIPVMQFTILAFGKKVQKLSRISQDRLADASVIVNETYQAIPTIKAFLREQIECLRYTQAIGRAVATARLRIVMHALLNATIITLMFGSLTFMMWVGAREVISDRLQAGVLGQFMLYAFFASTAVSSLAEVWSDVLRSAGAMERIVELFEERPRVRSPDIPRPLARPVRGELRFEQVNFHYPSRPGHPALHDFNLIIRPGETVALVGPSGAGKSTVFALLLRYYDPQQGRICLDGVDLRHVSLDELRGSMSLVPQDTVIFGSSAAHNIRFGRENASAEEVRDAAHKAEADGFIQFMSDGYNTQLGERGLRLSGGQRQRIAIARAILKNAPLLLLDEATAALDAQSESSIQCALEQLAKERTTLIIAHRLSTIRSADRIIVMDQGRIMAEGTHESLLAAGGLYRDLARLQFLA